MHYAAAELYDFDDEKVEAFLFVSKIGLPFFLPPTLVLDTLGYLINY